MSDHDQDSWTYEYDYENRLVKVTKAEEDEIRTVTFKYDPFGRRIEKRVEEIESHHRSSCVKTKSYSYVYDNEDIILEIRSGGDDEDDEEDEGRSKFGKHWRKRASKPAVSRFVHGPGIDEPLAIEQKGRVYYYHADGLGSITSLTDGKGQVVQSYEYDSFGNMRHEGNHVKQPYGFTAREWDKETGLYFYRARYYDPQAGRFISKDPIGFGGGVNLYIYVQNNPILLFDPSGLIPQCGYEVTGNPWKQFTGNTRPASGLIDVRAKNFPPEAFTLPNRRPDDYFSVYKIVTYEVEWIEQEYVMKQARLWVCYDKCGNKVYEGWAPSTTIGAPGWEKVEGTERVTGKRFLPRFDWEFGL